MNERTAWEAAMQQRNARPANGEFVEEIYTESDEDQAPAPRPAGCAGIAAGILGVVALIVLGSCLALFPAPAVVCAMGC